MATNYPTSLDTLTNPASTDDMNTVSHADQHANANDAIEALQTKVGVDSSAVATSLDYKLTNASSSNPGHVHTASAVSDFDTEVSNNTDVSANTTHRTSTGADHTYIDQSVVSGATPTFTNTNFSASTDKNYVTDAQLTVIGNTSGTNTGDVTLAGTPDYITITGQEITRGQIDLTTDVTGVLPEANLPNASTTAEGVVELTTAAEVTTGTDTTRAVTADAFSGSDYGKRVVGIQVVDFATATATGDGKAFFRVPSVMNGWNLVGVAANVATAGTTGTTDIQIHNVTDAVDMLSTAITIDSAETDSSTAATPAVINTATDDVATGDKIRIDIDAVSTTAAQGLYVEMVFQLP